MLCTINFLTNNYKLSSFFNRVLPFLGRRLSCSCLVMYVRLIVFGVHVNILFHIKVNILVHIK